MSEVLSPEILIIMNTQGGGNDMGGGSGVCPPPPRPSGGKPARPHYNVRSQEAPQATSKCPTLGDSAPMRPPRGWVVQHLYIHTHLVCS